MSQYVDKKQICFDGSAKLHADLKIRLHTDGIKIKDFFNEIVLAYVNRDAYLIEFVESLKEKKEI